MSIVTQIVDNPLTLGRTITWSVLPSTASGEESDPVDASLWELVHVIWARDTSQLILSSQIGISTAYGIIDISELIVPGSTYTHLRGVLLRGPNCINVDQIKFKLLESAGSTDTMNVRLYMRR